MSSFSLPELGRFLSADPVVQAPFNPQTLNRYSYVLNNPLSFTDPSGYFLKGLFRGLGNLLHSKAVRIVVAVAALAFAPKIGTAVTITGMTGHLRRNPQRECGTVNGVLAEKTVRGYGSSL